MCSLAAAAQLGSALTASSYSLASSVLTLSNNRRMSACITSVKRERGEPYLHCEPCEPTQTHCARISYFELRPVALGNAPSLVDPRAEFSEALENCAGHAMIRV
jgi:hypothetical protein